MKNKIIAILSAALLCFGGMCGITAHANYDSTAAAPAATETPKPARTISTAGAGATCTVWWTRNPTAWVLRG